MSTEHDFINCIYEYVLESISKHEGISKEMAVNIALEASENTRHMWAGTLVYIPKDSARFYKAKSEKIRNDFTGRNHRELAFKYGLSLQRIYKILKNKKHPPTQK